MKAKKKAPASTEARKNNLLKVSYQKPAMVSTEKLSSRIGEFLLLLFIGYEQPEGWQQFERLLCQFYEGGAL